MSNYLYHYIREHGFEVTLEELISYAEIQARFHQSVGQCQEWEFWAKIFLNLEQVESQLMLNAYQTDWLEAWNKHLEDYRTSLDNNLSE